MSFERARLTDILPSSREAKGLGKSIGGRRLVAGDAVELAWVPSGSGGWGDHGVSLTITGNVRSLGGALAELGSQWARLHEAEPSQKKVSLRSVHATDGRPKSIELTVDETEWSQVQPIHGALEAAQPAELRSALIRRFRRFGTIPGPNILSIHGIIETSDELIVLSQRSAEVRYHPLHWSISFEEQVEPSDLSFGEAALHHAATRGLSEEFHADAVAADSCRLLSVCIEARILNPAVVAYVQTSSKSEELVGARLRNSEEIGPKGLRFLPVDLQVLAKAAAMYSTQGRSGLPQEPWHPTSLYRLVVAMVHRFGAELTFRELGRRLSQQTDPC